LALDAQYGPLWKVGAAWLDVNNDGLLDLFVVNYLAWNPNTEPACEAAPGKLDYCHPKFYKPTPNQLFLNNGDGTFRDVSEESGIRAYPGKGMGVGIADYDLDGLMDIFVTNNKMNNSFFHNKGAARFEEIAFQSGVALAENGQFISGMGLEFELRGTKSNRDGVGARIKVVAGGTTQYNQVSFAAGYASSSAGPTHFGLGANKLADRVEIRWPSGITQELKNVTADQIVTVKEPPK